MKEISFKELENAKQFVRQQVVGWQRDVNKCKGVKLEAFEAGLEKGMARLVSRLREQGYVIVATKP